jgi:hypothetical protein
VVIDTVERHQWGWLFSPQLAESDPAVRPRQPGARARSILFDRFSGLAIELGLDEPTSLHVRRYEATWWPFRL